MKRFHVNVTVDDLAESTRFYSLLFDREPTVMKDDYAKWMLDDPRINFSIATGGAVSGINHVGIQAESMQELEDIQSRLQQAGTAIFDQPQAECCYAKSAKTWVRDPSNVSWETFFTYGESTVYGEDRAPAVGPPEGEQIEQACCNQAEDSCCSPA